MLEPEPAFIMGMMFGGLLLWFVQSLAARRRRRPETGRRLASALLGDRGPVRDFGDLYERVAVLERITTDPAGRTAAGIERLR